MLFVKKVFAISPTPRGGGNSTRVLVKIFKWDVLALHGKTEQVEFLSKYPPSVYLLRRKMQSGNWGKSINFSYWIFVEFVE